MLDHEITYELRASVKGRHQKDSANDRKLITAAQREKRRLAVMDRQVPWSKFKGKKAWVDIENRVDGYFPVVCRHIGSTGHRSLGLGRFGPIRCICVVQT